MYEKHAPCEKEVSGSSDGLPLKDKLPRAPASDEVSQGKDISNYPKAN